MPSHPSLGRIFRISLVLAAALSTHAHAGDPSSAASAPAFAARTSVLVDPTPQQKSRCAQAANEAGRNFCLKGYTVAPLVLPTDIHEGQSGPTMQMGIFKPPGPGPFPAIILLHTCATMELQSQMPFWVSSALEHGYVAFVLDSFTQRGVTSSMGCGPGLPGASIYAMRARDTYAAADHLAGFAFVDPNRVAVIGFSQGARMAYLLTADPMRRAFSQHTRISSAIALYGECHNPTLNVDFVPAAPNIPLLALLGDADNDGDVHDCLPLLERALASGAQVEWTIFPGIGHDWDHPDAPGKTVPQPGVNTGWVWMQYDRATTLKSRDQAFAFLARTLHGP